MPATMNISSRITVKFDRVSSNTAWGDAIPIATASIARRPRAAGVARQRHREGEDELRDEQPAADERIDQQEHDRVRNEERDDGDLVPARRVAEEVAGEGGRQGSQHTASRSVTAQMPADQTSRRSGTSLCGGVVPAVGTPPDPGALKLPLRLLECVSFA
ncbi:hypothetical protein GCM10025881_22790 [Pseudolysinimonas kribbensis]|uniref:Uncharacterized protein n=1 Tax=Pseudolysinimonas kribbensis TaxID=433641 RepID=A0ABQ6K8Y7_9MICO|nr:hypothetical protein GCM10025881_22790 [Pseudolysinimonas kribbensis]